MTVEVWLDGKKQKEVEITAEEPVHVRQQVRARRRRRRDRPAHDRASQEAGTGPLYYNAYLTNFTLEDFITKAGLEIKVEPQVSTSSMRGRQDDQRGRLARPGGRSEGREVRARGAAEPGDTLKSGDLVEIELEIDSKNDYEYLVFEDMKAAGFEPVDVRSGYNGNELGAYMELRDNRVVLLRPRAGPRQAQRRLPHAGRDPRQVQRPADPRLGDVRPGAEGQLATRSSCRLRIDVGHALRANRRTTLPSRRRSSTGPRRLRRAVLR